MTSVIILIYMEEYMHGIRITHAVHIHAHMSDVYVRIQ